ncbi:MAG: hypothetical protein U1E64_13810 [Sphingomonadaceae bacterium]
MIGPLVWGKSAGARVLEQSNFHVGGMNWVNGGFMTGRALTALV